MVNKPFDPSKPFTTRGGEPSTLVAVLDKPQPNGETLVIQDGSGKIHAYFSDGRYLDDSQSVWDLVNIPERMEIDAWAVIDRHGRTVETWSRKEFAVNCANHYLGARVVRLTGSYEG